MTLSAWLRQPSTIHGLGVAAAAVGATLTQLTTGNQFADAFIGMVAYALVHIGINDHTVAPPQ